VVLARRPCSLGLWVGTGEARCKTSPCALHSGNSSGASCRQRYSQLPLTRQMTLLQLFLVPEQALLRLQQALLCALLARALRVLRLQLLHALL